MGTNNEAVQEGTPAEASTSDNTESIPANVDTVTSPLGFEDFVSDLEGEEVNDDVPQHVEEPVDAKATPDTEEEEEEDEEEPPVIEEPPVVDEVQSLREQLANLSAVLIQHGIDPSNLGTAEAPTPNVPTPGQPTPPVAATLAPRSVDLEPLALSQEEFDAVFEKPENLIGLLNKVRESAVEQVLRSVPTLAANIVNQQTVLNRMVQDFYTTNSDLAGVKPFVAVVANEISAKNPGWSVDQVFAEAAKLSRERLQLKDRSVNATPPANARKPALPGKKAAGRVNAPPALSKLESELADMMD